VTSKYYGIYVYCDYAGCEATWSKESIREDLGYPEDWRKEGNRDYCREHVAWAVAGINFRNAATVPWEEIP